MKELRIAIIDYGMGNLASVAKAFEFLGSRVCVTSSPKVVASSKALVFPGVGAFGEAMAEVKKRKLKSPIIGSIREGKPFLGLCLGLQLLFEKSEESPGVRGLGVLPGEVRRLPSRGGKIPHMGWNQIEKVTGNRLQVTGSLLRGVPDGAFMYFVHSYYAQPEERNMIAATTDYTCHFPSVVWDGKKVWATQFHPEKSQRFGLRILKNFLREVGSC